MRLEIYLPLATLASDSRSRKRRSFAGGRAALDSLKNMSILTIRFIPGLLWHNFWELPLQLCVARAGCCGHAPVRGACAILSAAFRVGWW